jgi:hypothetical protein
MFSSSSLLLLLLFNYRSEKKMIRDSYRNREREKKKSILIKIKKKFLLKLGNQQILTSL